MKLRTNLRSLALAGLVLASAAALTGRAHAQSLLSFTGGSGAPLKMTLAEPVTFTITANYSGTAEFLVFRGLAANNTTFAASLSGTITYSVNGGANNTFYQLADGYGGGIIKSTDGYLQGNAAALSIGQTVTLAAGTLTTSGNFSGPRPADGSFTTFFFNASGAQISTNGVSAAVPEPSTYAMLLGAAGVFAFVRFRKAKAVSTFQI